jgi:hypothetical protein
MWLCYSQTLIREAYLVYLITKNTPNWLCIKISKIVPRRLSSTDNNKIFINPHKSLEDFDLKRIFADIRHKQDKIGEGEI